MIQTGRLWCILVEMLTYAFETIKGGNNFDQSRDNARLISNTFNFILVS